MPKISSLMTVADGAPSLPSITYFQAKGPLFTSTWLATIYLVSVTLLILFAANWTKIYSLRDGVDDFVSIGHYPVVDSGECGTDEEVRKRMKMGPTASPPLLHAKAAASHNAQDGMPSRHHLGTNARRHPLLVDAPLSGPFRSSLAPEENSLNVL